MGLNFSISDASWSYSGFHQFRKRLAASIGFNLDDMYGFGGTGSWALIKDNIKPFLKHSDCSGYLTIQQMTKVIPRLRIITACWPENDYDRKAAARLADDMEQAVKKGTHCEFC